MRPLFRLSCSYNAPVNPDLVLGIETSCDETSAAVLKRGADGPQLESLTILSQDIHEVFGGVVPELASRAHLESITRVVERALREASTGMPQIDGIAVTAGPGLLGALLVGLCYAKGLALALQVPLVGVNHLEGHVFAASLEDPGAQPPFIALLVSGGHTMLLDVPEWGRYRLLGQTRDDAAGEAFDKVASMLDLSYPGGPEVEKLAATGTPSIDLPRPMINKGYDFSFSGLKTAVLYKLKEDPSISRADLAASFQDAVFDVLIAKVKRALKKIGRERVVIGGGVACSRSLATRARAELGDLADLSIASPRLNADNAAMIARAGWFHLERGNRSDGYLDAGARLPWPGLEPLAPEG